MWAGGWGLRECTLKYFNPGDLVRVPDFIVQSNQGSFRGFHQQLWHSLDFCQAAGSVYLVTQITPDQLASWVSSERLERYRQDSSDPVALYMHNAKRSVVMSEIILHIEVLVRNVIHRELSSTQRAEHTPWYCDAEHYKFNDHMKRKLQDAVKKAGGPGSPGGKVVAELMFGTWRFLLSSHYQATVWAVVSRGFSGKPRSQRKRAELYTAMDSLNKLRNRCSHAEPIYFITDEKFMSDVRTVATYVDPNAAKWLQELWEERTQDFVPPPRKAQLTTLPNPDTNKR